MGLKTAIETCDSTVNPTAGCNGCELWDRRKGGTCYAAGIHTRFCGTNPAYGRPFHLPEPKPGRMEKAASWPDLCGKARPQKPWLDGLPRIIFIGDMGDVFCKEIPWPYLRVEVLGAIRSPAGQRHFWMIYTKRPAMASLFGRWLRQVHGESWPANLMLVASATNQTTLKARSAELARADCSWRGLSLEPFSGPVNLFRAGIRFRSIDWIIAGGNSDRRGERIQEETVNRLWDECYELSIPLFFKQWGHGRPGREIDGERIEEMPEGIGARG